MKNKLFITLLLLVMSFVLTGCNENKKEIDYSEYSFTNTIWTRSSEYDIETIRFSADGSFSYYCACGNPVNDSDLCETYSYDNKTKEIKLNCFETTESTITTIKVISYDENNLELDFNGEIRKFVK